MTDSKHTEIRDALKNDDDFLLFLKQESRSDDFLSLKKAAENGQHPAPEMLYQYVSDDSDNKNAEVIREHIFYCGFCAEEVLRLRQLEEETEESPADNLWDRLKDFFSETLRLFQPRYLIPAFGMAVLCVFMVFWWNYQSADVGMLMGESYRMVSSSAAGVNFNEKIRFPWENPTNIYGFGSVSSLSPAAAAFADGMKLGREELSTKKAGISQPADRQFPEYFALGRWCVLLQAACLPEAEAMPDHFWKNQKLILSAMQKDFRKSSDSEAETVRASLDKIGSLLKDSPDKRECQAIAKEADLLIRQVVR